VILPSLPAAESRSTVSTLARHSNQLIDGELRVLDQLHRRQRRLSIMLNP
jgi:hypothetical protein